MKRINVCGARLPRSDPRPTTGERRGGMRPHLTTSGGAGGSHRSDWRSRRRRVRSLLLRDAPPTAGVDRQASITSTTSVFGREALAQNALTLCKSGPGCVPTSKCGFPDECAIVEISHYRAFLIYSWMFHALVFLNHFEQDIFDLPSKERRKSVITSYRFIKSHHVTNKMSCIILISYLRFYHRNVPVVTLSK